MKANHDWIGTKGRQALMERLKKRFKTFVNRNTEIADLLFKAGQAGKMTIRDLARNMEGMKK